MMSESAGTLIGWERALMAAEKVKERLRRATATLDNAKVPYAVVGGNAVAEWVARADEGAVRNTRDVDVVVRRADESVVKAALALVGFSAHQRRPIDSNLRGDARRPAETVYLLFANERFLPTDGEPMPGVDDSVIINGFSVVRLHALVHMKLMAHRLIDRVHICDLIAVGLIDATWPAKFPSPLAARLQDLLNDPDG